jgi:hypothetical protein
LLLVGASGCTWKELDALVLLSDASVGGATQGMPTNDEDSGAPELESGDDGAGGVESPDSEASDLEASSAETGVMASTASLPCTSTQTVVRQWTFDTSTEGWTIDSDPNFQSVLAWTGTIGYPAPGALAIDVTPPDDAGPSSGVLLEYTTSLGSLAGRVASAWVWLDSGSSPKLKMFAQTGAQYAWADNGTVTLAPKTWTCVALPLSTPSFNNVGYDPTNVIALGFEMLATSPFHVYVDTVRYY